MAQTLVSTKYQVVIPKLVRRKLGIKPGQRMNVDISGEQIVLSPSKTKKEWVWPDDYIKNLRGTLKIKDVAKYIDKERNSWE